MGHVPYQGREGGGGGIVDPPLHNFFKHISTVYFTKTTISEKNMFNQDEEKMECAVGNREMGFWQCKKAEIVLILFLTS